MFQMLIMRHLDIISHSDTQHLPFKTEPALKYQTTTLAFNT